MKLFDGGIVILLVVAVIAGVGASIYYLGHDNPVEETAEAVIEDRIEDALGLPDGSIEIDITPGSKESSK